MRPPCLVIADPEFWEEERERTLSEVLESITLKGSIPATRDYAREAPDPRRRRPLDKCGDLAV